MMRCPSTHLDADQRSSSVMSYVGIAGLGSDTPWLPIRHPRAGIFGYDRQTRVNELKDGTSTTMLLAETAVDNGIWSAGGSATVRGLDPSRQPYIGPGLQFGGLMVAFADGSVRFIKETIAPKIFEVLSRVAGNEELPSGWER